MFREPNGGSGVRVSYQEETAFSLKALCRKQLRSAPPTRARPRPIEPPRDEGGWLATFEQLGRQGVFEAEPDFPTALAEFRTALHAARGVPPRPVGPRSRPRSRPASRHLLRPPIHKRPVEKWTRSTATGEPHTTPPRSSRPLSRPNSRRPHTSPAAASRTARPRPRTTRTVTGPRGTPSSHATRVSSPSPSGHSVPGTSSR